jgi:ferredoxin
VIGEKCRLCGRCARFCPQGAIKLRLNNPRLKEDYRRRVDPHVQIG